MADKQVPSKLSEDIICMTAARTAAAVPGVNHLCDTLADNITRMIAGKEGDSKGVRLSRDKDCISLDIFLVADYGVKIPQLAWDIQSEIKKSVAEITDTALNAVNIHVQGVALPERFRSNNE